MTFETSHRIVVVELNIPEGPKTSYALLGAELVNSNARDLEVFVSVKANGAPYYSLLASKFDEVIVGLPNEYASAVFKGAETVANKIGAPTSADIRFLWAAHGQVNSSPWAFETVSELVMRLLLLSKDATERQVEAVFE
jgi:hypothetical protein